MSERFKQVLWMSAASFGPAIVCLGACMALAVCTLTLGAPSPAEGNQPSSSHVDWHFDPNWVVAAFTGLLFIVAYRQAGIASRQADISSESLEESRKANDAAKAASEDTKRYIEFIESADVQITKVDWGPGGVTQNDAIECHFRNFGKTAATAIDLMFRFDPQSAAHYRQLPQFNLGADQLDSLPIDLEQIYSGEELTAIRAGTMRLSFDVVGSYRDVFKRSKQLYFRGHYNRTEQRFIVTRYDSHSE